MASGRPGPQRDTADGVRVPTGAARRRLRRGASWDCDGWPASAFQGEELMRRRRVLAACAAAMAIMAAPASAQAPPGAADGVSLVASLPELKAATAINFLQYGNGTGSRDVMFATGRFGLAAYDISDPRRPRLLDGIDNEGLRLAGDLPVDGDETDGTLSTYWQNEDMDLDVRRKLVFLARDPRSF